MILYPAIDLRGGRVVRLREGDPQQETVFGEDPLEVARDWCAQGAAWLHVVNLDGAFASANAHLRLLERIAALGVHVQFGGGLRTLRDMQHALDLGAGRIVLGTVALREPQLVAEALRQFGAEAICVALDARDGRVAIHGWQEVSDHTPEQLGLAMRRLGLRHALFTDVRRDGMLTGANVEATLRLAKATGLQVIASGGVSSLAEIAAIRRSGCIAGAVVGMALYCGAFTLEAALRAARGEPPC